MGFSDDGEHLDQLAVPTDADSLPFFIETRRGSAGTAPRIRVASHEQLILGCRWDCAMKYAAKQPMPTIIPSMDDGDG